MALPAPPEGDGGQRRAEAKQGGSSTASESVPGKLAGVLTLERTGKGQSSTGVEKRTFFVAVVLDK